METSSFSWKRPDATDRLDELQLCLDESWKISGTHCPICQDNTFITLLVWAFS